MTILREYITGIRYKRASTSAVLFIMSTILGVALSACAKVLPSRTLELRARF